MISLAMTLVILLFVGGLIAMRSLYKFQIEDMRKGCIAHMGFREEYWQGLYQELLEERTKDGLFVKNFVDQDQVDKILHDLAFRWWYLSKTSDEEQISGALKDFETARSLAEERDFRTRATPYNYLSFTVQPADEQLVA
jgi:hypothetical protein